jgi:hypothetical protein
MKTYLSRSVVIALIGAMLSTAALAATEESKKATNLLFEGKHIANVAPGTELVYKFERLPSNEKVLGPGFTDTITVKVESDAAPGKKNVVVNMFTGDRAHDPNHLTDMDGNPMLLVFLETALGHFQLLAGGDRGYLKSQFTHGIGDTSTLAPVKISYKGAEVDGYKVTVIPFVADPAKARMHGFEGSVFTLVLSDKIPGKFAQMVSDYKNSQTGGPELVEKMTLEGVGDVK